jgi:peptide/nickel transport system permease protein
MSTGSPELLYEPEPDATEPETASEIAARSPLQLFARRLRKDKLALIALGFVILICLVGIFAPVITSIAGTPGPNATNADLTTDFGQPLGPGGTSTNAEGEPIKAGPFGVDDLGRDVFSRVIYGARVSLEVAFISTALIIVIGVTLGMLAGYYRGWLDTLLTRTMDVALAFPVLILAIGIGVACSGAEGCAGGLLQPGLSVVVFVIVLATWPYMARIVAARCCPCARRSSWRRPSPWAPRTSGSSSGRSCRTSSRRSSSTGPS